jgi:hypothetical protein
MEKLNLETIQWTSLPDIDDVEPISDKDYEVLSELQAVLLKHSYRERFGLCLLHKHFDLGENEILMETTDPEARVSILKVEDASAASSGSIETMWKFSSRRGPQVAVHCVIRCRTIHDGGHLRQHSRPITNLE